MNDKECRQVLKLLEDKQVNLWWFWSYIRQGLTPSQIVEKYNNAIPFENGKLTIEDVELLSKWHSAKFNTFNIRKIPNCIYYDNGRCDNTREREECECGGIVEKCYIK